MRLSQCILMVLLIIVGFAVYSVADEYQGIEKKINRIEKKSEMEREAIRVMRAEWAFLTNPTRMEKIAQQYFHLQPLTEKQMVIASTIPMRAMLDEHLNTQDASDDDAQVQTATTSVMPAPKALPPVQPASMQGGGQ